MDTVIDLKKYSSFIKKTDFVKKTGKVNRVIGLILEGDGPAVSVGSLCTIYPNNRPPIQAQVVGFRDQSTLLRSEEHTSELQSPRTLVCRLLLDNTIII